MGTMKQAVTAATREPWSELITARRNSTKDEQQGIQDNEAILSRRARGHAAR